MSEHFGLLKTIKLSLRDAVDAHGSSEHVVARSPVIQDKNTHSDEKRGNMQKGKERGRERGGERERESVREREGERERERERERVRE